MQPSPRNSRAGMAAGATFYYDGGDPARGLDVTALLRTRPSAAHAYVCGPAGLIRATREAGA